MGDRTYARILIGGHLETVAECEKLIEGMMAGSFSDDGADRWTAMLRAAVEKNDYLEDEGDEINYGVFEEIEAAVTAIPGLGCSTDFDSGGGYGAGTKTIMPDKSERRCSQDDGVMVDLITLINRRNEPDPLAAIDALIEDTHIAAGDRLPKLTASPAVHAYLKIFGEKAA